MTRPSPGVDIARSLENIAEYEPDSYAERVAAALLVVVAEHDTIADAVAALAAHERASQPKQLVLLPDELFDVYRSHHGCRRRLPPRRSGGSSR